MHNSHHPGPTVLVSFLLCLSLLFATPVNSVRAQQDAPPATTARGIELYQAGDAPNAIKVLEKVVKKHADDVDAWYYLGLTYYRLGWAAEARRPFGHVIDLRPDSADATAKLSCALIFANEPGPAMTMAQRAIDLGDKSAEPHYALAEGSLRLAEASPTTAPTVKADESIRITKALETAVEQADLALAADPTFALALITKSFAQSKLRQYTEAAVSLEQFVALRPNDPDADLWRERSGEMYWRAGKLLAQFLDPKTSPEAAKKTNALSPKEVDQKSRVLSKPEPKYTEAARKAGVTGTIVLRAVFASDGNVTNLSVSQALPFGLTTEALNAARKIRFTPAIKDGVPVSMYIQLEYNFNLY
jgi:TonB family protein